MQNHSPEFCKYNKKPVDNCEEIIIFSKSYQSA